MVFKRRSIIFFKMNQILILFLSIILSTNLFSQDSISTASIGLVISFELQHNTSNNTEQSITPAATIGIEYAEYKKRYSYRGGLYYSRKKDLDILPYLDYIGIGSSSEPAQIFPSVAVLTTLDLSLSLQIFYYTEPKMKLYGNLGLLNSFSFYNNEDYEFFGQRYDSFNRSLTLRALAGGGVIFKIKENLGLDISAGRKISLYTFEDHFIRPFDSFSFQLKLEYFF